MLFGLSSLPLRIACYVFKVAFTVLVHVYPAVQIVMVESVYYYRTSASGSLAVGRVDEGRLVTAVPHAPHLQNTG